MGVVVVAGSGGRGRGGWARTRGTFVTPQFFQVFVETLGVWCLLVVRETSFESRAEIAMSCRYCISLLCADLLPVEQSNSEVYSYSHHNHDSGRMAFWRMASWVPLLQLLPWKHF